MGASQEKHQEARVVWRKDHAPDLWSIRIQPEQRLPFKPGQYATLGVEQDGQVIEKPYSIVSSPFEEEIEFFFELVPSGELSPFLYKLQPGDTVLMRRQAKGLFTLDPRSDHDQHFLVSTVTGVAPYVSMVRTLKHERGQGRNTDSKLVILQAASRSWELAYHEELESFASQFSQVRYIPTVSRPWEDSAWKGEVGRIEDVLRKYLDLFRCEPSNTRVYLCGHPQMIETSKGILRRRGFSKESIREEIYWVPKKDTTT